MSERLQRSWEITRDHLRLARACLPGGLDDSPYLEYLAHNELELALDALEELEDQAGPAFWGHLADAAEQMQLLQRAARLRAR